MWSSRAYWALIRKLSFLAAGALLAACAVHANYMAAAQSQLPSKSPGTSTPPPPPANAPACPSSGLDLRLAGASSASGAARAFEVVNATGSACSLPTVPAVTVLYNSGASGPLRATPEGEAAQRSSLVVPSGQAATYTVAEPPCGSATGGPPP
ncbi:MAG: DUF4232 domain-containing protein, partial [Mycobacteriales bacterium]